MNEVEMFNLNAQNYYEIFKKLLQSQNWGNIPVCILSALGLIPRTPYTKYSHTCL